MHEPLRGLLASDSGATGQSAQNAILDLLRLEGCRPRAEGEGVIYFDHHELKFVLLLSPNDPEFVRVLLPNFCAVRNDAERVVAHAAANVVNRTCMAVKVYVEGQQTQAAVECFLAAPTQIVPVLMRCARALEHGARTFAVARAMQQDR